MFDLEAFEGKICNVKKERLTHTSGTIEPVNIKTKKSAIITGDIIDITGSGGGGSINTVHFYYTDFDIGDKSFRCEGDYTFKDGDTVVLYAYLTNQGFYQIEALKNLSRDFYAIKLKKPENPIWFMIKSILAFLVGLPFMCVLFGTLIFAVLFVFGVVSEKSSDTFIDVGIVITIILVGLAIAYAVKDYLLKKKLYPLYLQKYYQILQNLKNYEMY